ncbi:proton-conducting transporter transmembrane domain-containing protein [Frankia tisae]|uniref:proton-conducting transporter transmembrane domain-containing protein n=1 Tax=Frankia tisae TaxID=2950104 RepID=UPI0034D59D65
MTAAMITPLLAPLAGAVVVGAAGWRRATGCASVAAAVATLVSGGILAAAVGSGHVFAAGRLLRADALTAVMTIVIGAVATLATWGSIAYLDTERARGHTTSAHARTYGILVNLFLATMALAVLANNLGVVWVAVEGTTVATAFLVGHRRTRASLEATWKYVIICSVGIALAFLGTVVLYFASVHAGAAAAGGGGLDFDTLAAAAPHLDPDVTRLAVALLLLGYGTKAGLAPFHTWLADAHSQAPAPVSALMSGVLLSVAFTTLLRVKVISDGALGPGFLRAGLLTLGLATLLVAALLLVGQRDYKRMLAYSSQEHMGLLAVAAAAGTDLAIAALLLHVLAHGLGKSVLFLSAGHLQLAHDSTAIADARGVLARGPLLGAVFGVGLVALLGLPPFALFSSEVGIARGAADAHLAGPLVAALIAMLVAFVALTRRGIDLLLGPAAPDGPALRLRPTVAAPLVVGVVACVALGLTAGPLEHLLTTAGGLLAPR